MPENEKTSPENSETTDPIVDSAEDSSTAEPIGEVTPEETPQYTPSIKDVSDSIENDRAEESDIDSIIDEVLSESDESIDGDTETSDSEESADSETTDEKDNKDGFKKGLDKVKAQRDEAIEKAKQLEEQISQLAKKFDKFEENSVKLKDEAPKDADAISDSELVDAVKTFIEEGDAQGIMDVIDYKLDKQAKALKDEYSKAEQQKIKAIQDKQVEWQTILKEYSPETYDVVEIKENPDFDIRNASSALYKLADELYSKGINEQNSRYAKQGGMKVAVEDAFMRLLKKMVGKGKQGGKKIDKQTEGLQNRLAKEQRKKTVGSGASAVDSSKSGKPKTPASDLDSYLAERRSDKMKKTGVSF